MRRPRGGRVGTSHGVERLDCSECFDVCLRLLAIEHNLIMQVGLSLRRLVLLVVVLGTLGLRLATSRPATLRAGAVVPAGGAAFSFRILSRRLLGCRGFSLPSLRLLRCWRLLPTGHSLGLLIQIIIIGLTDVRGIL